MKERVEVASLEAMICLPDGIERDARLRETIDMVGEACLDIGDFVAPVDRPEPATKPKQAPFTFLTNNTDSPYKTNYPADYQAVAKKYLRSLGYSNRIAGKGFNEAHDSHPDYQRGWDWRHYGISAQQATSSHRYVWGRTTSITVERPDIALRATEKGWSIFESKTRQAAFALIMRASKITEEDVERIQVNLDAWETAR